MRRVSRLSRRLPPDTVPVLCVAGDENFCDSDEFRQRQGSQFGASPRGTIGLERCSRVNAWMQNRDFVTPDDVQEVIKDVLRHRIALSYKARAEGVSVDAIIDKLIQVVAVAG